MFPDHRPQIAARGIDRIRIHIGADFTSEIGLARRRKCQRDKGRLQRGILEDRAECIHQSLVKARLAARADRGGVALEQSHCECLDRLPAVEWVAIMSGQEAQLVGLDRESELDWRREAAVERKRRWLGHIIEHKRLVRLRKLNYPARERPAVKHERQVAAIATDQTERKRNDHWLFVGLPRCRWHDLRQLK